MQLSLFSEKEIKEYKRKGKTSVEFYDYDSFLKKFAIDNLKTTDDCYTPPDVYEAIVSYVGTFFDLHGKKILRPFYPGGDYLNAIYPENGIVIDNPPFSLFKRIVDFFIAEKIPFFLFGPGMTILNASKACSCVIIGNDIKFLNGAKIKVCFVTNLLGDVRATTAPELDEAILKCESQIEPKANLNKYRFPKNTLSVSELQSISRLGEFFEVKNSESIVTKNINGLRYFGDRLFISDKKARELEMKKRELEMKKRELEMKKRELEIPVLLTEREQKLIEELNKAV